MSSSLAASDKKLDLIGADKHVHMRSGASFASVPTCVRHIEERSCVLQIQFYFTLFDLYTWHSDFGIYETYF